MHKTLKAAVLVTVAVAVLGGCARFPLGPIIDRRTDPGAPHPGDPARGPQPAR
jgi:hypothetical protein